MKLHNKPIKFDRPVCDLAEKVIKVVNSYNSPLQFKTTEKYVSNWCTMYYDEKPCVKRFIAINEIMADFHIYISSNKTISRYFKGNDYESNHLWNVVLRGL